MLKLYVLVYKGEPLDCHEYRHTALYLKTPDNQSFIMHILGTQGMFEYAQVKNSDPSAVGSLAKVVPVAEISDAIGSGPIQSTVAKTLIKNGPQDLDWNCQHWVGEALSKLAEREYITVLQRAEAIDRMMDACLEAVDD
ncbi:uncharacterized protein CDV56_100371 [Aspergillus thermomutatus]|uniref:Uncharacterized protein n=1 Tax=Aspergillus thermomutatus TaxID=41047 RepID=A0A397GGE7_ASPTH|nr:uncharacterized protein CDV56_100371 [Aspergillus thermomutatus]RHZ49209.1 hypothetical protein CDV56_100371 [Aspergillus thermomutatus]